MLSNNFDSTAGSSGPKMSVIVAQLDVGQCIDTVEFIGGANEYQLKVLAELKANMAKFRTLVDEFASKYNISLNIKSKLISFFSGLLGLCFDSCELYNQIDEANENDNIADTEDGFDDVELLEVVDIINSEKYSAEIDALSDCIYSMALNWAELKSNCSTSGI